MAADLKTTNEVLRSPIDGTELVRLATTGANWKAPLSNVFGALGSSYVNVKSFGAVGNGSTDDTAAIQAAIDFAYANSRQVIYMPTGTYKITDTIYVDPPLNMRTRGLSNPNIFAFSMHLMGEPGGANSEGFGTIIAPTFANKIAVLLGTGRGMMASHIHIKGPAGDWYTGYRAAQNSAGVGLGISGGGSRTHIEDVMVTNFYTGFKTSANGDLNLADANTFVKCVVSNCYNGFYFSAIENFINSLYDCQSGATIAVNNTLSNNVNVYGGNMSAADSRFGYLTMSNVSAIGSTGGYYYIDVTLTTTARPTYDPLYNFSLGIFNAFAVLTDNFGAVPLTLVSQTTNTTDGIYPSQITARLRILDEWRNSVFIFDTDILPAVSGLEAELQAKTVLYCAERVITFMGACINADGIHIENPDAVSCFVDAFSGWAPGRKTTISSCMLNWEPSLSEIYNTPGNPSNYAAFVVQQCHPFIRVGAGDLKISDCDSHNSLALPYDWMANFQTSRLVMERNDLPPPNCRIGMRDGTFEFTDGQYHTNSNGAGGGEFDKLMTPAPQAGLYSDLARGKVASQPYWGYRPNPNTRPLLTPAHLSDLTGTLAAIDWAHPGQNMISYNVLWGGLPYNVFTALNSAKPNYGVVSDHFGWTVGQDLTHGAMAVSYKGKSNCVYMDNTSILMMFPGLIIILSDGITNHKYMVNGIYDQLGYVTVVLADNNNSSGGISGDKTVVYTATTIGQQPFALRFLDAATLINYKEPTAGFNYTLGNNDNELILKPAGTLATGTVVMCAAPYDTMRVSIRSTQIITALTVSPNSGQSVVGAPTSLAIGQVATAVYRKTDTTWYF